MRVRFQVSPALFILAMGLVGATANAQLTTYHDESQFVAAVGSVPFESFEGVAPHVRNSDPVSVSAFTVTPVSTLLGVQDSANSPENGFGSFATAGTHYLFAYVPGQPTGMLRFDLSHPTTAFGFDFTDLGETDGTLTIRTDTGETLSGLTAATYPPLFGNGNVQFFGFTQATPFTQVFVTADGIDDAYGLDKIYTQAVPEPGVCLQVLAGGVLGSVLLRRRRK